MNFINIFKRNKNDEFGDPIKETWAKKLETFIGKHVLPDNKVLKSDIGYDVNTQKYISFEFKLRNLNPEYKDKKYHHKSYYDLGVPKFYSGMEHFFFEFSKMY